MMPFAIKGCQQLRGWYRLGPGQEHLEIRADG